MKSIEDLVQDVFYPLFRTAFHTEMDNFTAINMNVRPSVGTLRNQITYS